MISKRSPKPILVFSFIDLPGLEMIFWTRIGSDGYQCIFWHHHSSREFKKIWKWVIFKTRFSRDSRREFIFKPSSTLFNLQIIYFVKIVKQFFKSRRVIREVVVAHGLNEVSVARCLITQLFDGCEWLVLVIVVVYFQFCFHFAGLVRTLTWLTIVYSSQKVERRAAFKILLIFYTWRGSQRIFASSKCRTEDSFDCRRTPASFTASLHKSSACRRFKFAETSHCRFAAKFWEKVFNRKINFHRPKLVSQWSAHNCRRLKCPKTRFEEALWP